MYAVIDIESNGAGFRQESIIDIAIFRYDGHKIVDQFISLVNPEAEIGNYVQQLTKITPKMVKTAPKFHEIAKRVIEITDGATLVGHNIDFDYRMLRQSFRRLGYEFRINTLDTIPLAKKLIPDAESYSLGKLVKSLGIPLVDHHRAGGDARATLDLFKLLMNKDVNNEIIQSQFEEANSKTYINKVRELTQDLPNDKGIVYFQDEAGKILFSDFVEDINKFSKKLFNSKSKRLELVQYQTEQIHFDLVGNNIVAKLLMKSRGIHKKESLPFGLYCRKEKFTVEKIATNREEPEKPILKFTSFSQGMKVSSYLKKVSYSTDCQLLKTHLNLDGGNNILSIPGRVLGEKTFLLMRKNRVISYGFYEYYTQIQSLPKINKLKINLPPSGVDLSNDLKLALLQGDVEKFPFPTP